MENIIEFRGKSYEFADAFERDNAQIMLDRMLAANKASEYIHTMLAGLGKLSDKAEKFAALEIFQNATKDVRADAAIQSLVKQSTDQFSIKSSQLGVPLTSKLGNKIVGDIDIADDDAIYRALFNARDMKDEVTISFLNEDDTRYVRVAVESKDALALVERAVNAATGLVSDEVRAKGFKVVIGDDWYPEIRPVSSGGGSKAGLTKTRFVKCYWNHRQYDGVKKDVAKALIADGMPVDQKIGDKTVKLSGEYYSKWLDMLADAGAVADYEKYNKDTNS